MQTIEAGPSDEQIRALAEAVPTLPGRTHAIFEYGKAARTLCKEYYAKKYPGVPLAGIAEIKGMTAFHNSLKDLLERDFDCMAAVAKRLAAVHEAQQALNDLKASFNRLGTATKPLGKLMSIDEMEDRVEQLEQDRIHMEARHAAEKAQLDDEIDALEQAIAAERG